MIWKIRKFVGVNERTAEPLHFAIARKHVKVHDRPCEGRKGAMYLFYEENLRTGVQRVMERWACQLSTINMTCTNAEPNTRTEGRELGSLAPDKIPSTTKL